MGALLNLIGPDLGEETDANGKRVLFKRTLGMALALGELHARTAPDAPADISWLRPQDARAGAKNTPGDEGRPAHSSGAHASMPSAAARPGGVA